MFAVSKNKEQFLIIQLVEGNQHAFKELYYIYASAIRFNISKFIKDQETVNDLLQEVFIILWEHRQEIDPQKGVAPWLYTVSYNKALKYLRQKIKEGSTEVNPLLLSLLADETYSLQNDDEARLAIIYEAMDKLPERQRMAFSEYKLKGKSLSQVAEEMGITKDSVKGYLKDARKAILKYIQTHQSSLPPAMVSFLFCFFLF